jgi:hypothetical protein
MSVKEIWNNFEKLGERKVRHILASSEMNAEERRLAERWLEYKLLEHTSGLDDIRRERRRVIGIVERFFWIATVLILAIFFLVVVLLLRRAI